MGCSVNISHGNTINGGGCDTEKHRQMHEVLGWEIFVLRGFFSACKGAVSALVLRFSESECPDSERLGHLEGYSKAQTPSVAQRLLSMSF